MKVRKLVVLVLLMVLGCLSACGGGDAAPVSTTPAVTVVSAGNGIYLLQGSNLDRVAGIDITLIYDSTLLGSPTVTAGEQLNQATSIDNTIITGSVRFIAVNPTSTFKANGTLATISFATHSGAPSISISSVQLIDQQGRPVSLAP